MEPALQRALEDARAGRLPRAVGAARRFVALRPASVEGLQVLALLLSQSGQLEQGAAQLSRAVDLAPSSPQIRNNYANVLIRLRRYAEAATQARKAVELDPGYTAGFAALSCAQLYLPDSQGAIDTARRGLSAAPESPMLLKNLVLGLDQAGRGDEALRVAREAHRAAPESADVHSLYLMLLNYSEASASEIAAAHRRFGELHPSGPAPAVDANPERALRIGILSADLRTHSVAYFLQAIMEHAPSWAEVSCFSLSPAPGDAMTRTLQRWSDTWDEVGHLEDATLAAKVRERRIDILFDLMGHTGGNRLPALATRPAPVTVTAIGYPNTTGLGAIDARLVDAVTDPTGTEACGTEELVRIDPCFLCYTPPREAPEPAMPARSEEIVFGSFNAPAKIGDRTAALWGGVLRAVPSSRLMLKSRDLMEGCSREAVLARLDHAGIPRDRVTILDATSSVTEHLALYSRIHVALDTTPYNGTTTTCEALYMGVPVVAVSGDRHAARVGMSLLSAAGRREWIARDAEDFAKIAARLGSDLGGLEALRAGLRASLLQSTLCDAEGYARRVYSALRAVWRERCSRRGQPADR